MSDTFTSEEYEKMFGWLDNRVFNTRFPLLNATLAKLWKQLLIRQLRNAMKSTGVAKKWSEDQRRENIKKLTATFEDRFLRSMVSPGYACGTIAGQSFGERTTQLNLKLKGLSGTGASSRSGSLITQFESLINASNNPKNQRVEIRFSTNLTFRDLFVNRRQYQSVPLSMDGMILRSPEVLSKVQMINDPWYELFMKNYEVGEPDSDVGLRISFNPQMLYNYRISIEEIADDMRDDHWEIYFSPQVEGVIDIYPLPNYTDLLRRPNAKKEKPEEEEEEESEEAQTESEEAQFEEEEEENDFDETEEDEEVKENAQKTYFLRTVVITKLMALDFGKIPRDKKTPPINEISIEWDPISDLIWKEKTVSDGVEILINQKTVIQKGLTVEMLESFLNGQGWRTVTKTKEKLVVAHTDPERKSPRAEISVALDDPQLFDQVSKAYLVSLNGFEELLLSEGVDRDRSTTDALKPMKRVYGIEAARNTFIREIVEMLQGDQYISPIHIILTADTMTAGGNVTSFTRHGFGREKDGPLSRAMYEETLGALIGGATFPSVENRNIATSLLIGRPPAVGTGFIEVNMLPEYETRLKEITKQPAEDLTSQESEEIAAAILMGKVNISASTPPVKVPDTKPEVEEKLLPDVEVKPVPNLPRRKIPVNKNPPATTPIPIAKTQIPTAGNIPTSFTMKTSVSQAIPLKKPPRIPSGDLPRPMIPTPGPSKLFSPVPRPVPTPTNNSGVTIPPTAKLPDLPAENTPILKKNIRRSQLSFGGTSSKIQEKSLREEENNVEKP